MTPPDLAKTEEAACLAIDLGAGSGRVVLGSIAGGCWRLREIGRFRTPTRVDTVFGYQCWDTDEIAARLGISRDLVRQRLHRARLALRTLLADFMGGLPEAGRP